MPVVIDHPWDLEPREAIALQNRLRGLIVCEDRFGPVSRVAGVDVGFEDEGATTRAAVAVLTYPGLELVETGVARRRTQFPYVPGLLSFREIPAVLDALGALTRMPDLLLCDGQGIAHPRRLGIASHLGLIMDIPSIGVGKTRLWGCHDEIPPNKGEWTPLRDGDEIIGAVLRTRIGVKPLFISPGHRIGLESAIRYVMGCVTRYKLPETTRRAHRLASG
jgi:deoxyribonuclease V